MRKPRGGQIRANRLIGPRKVLGEGDRRVPAKGRGRTAPYRGRSAASWIWSTPLDASASEGELRSGYALTPSPSHSKNNLSFLQKGGPRKESSQRTATDLFFIPRMVENSASWSRIWSPNGCLVLTIRKSEIPKVRSRIFHDTGS